jgi:acyl-CoA thioester hydrolase
LEDQGLSYRELEEKGFSLPLRSLHLDYFKPLRFDDKARIRLKVANITRARFALEYEIYNHSGDVLMSRGLTEHVLLRNEKLVSIPQEWRDLWQPQKEKK